MSKKDEALKLALEAFEADASNENFLVLKHCVREALAEQPAQQQKEGFASPGGGYVPAIPRPIPLDWKLVPRKATPEMLRAMDECAQEGYDERLYAGMASSVYMAAWDASPVMGTLPEQPAQQSHCNDCGGFDPECPLVQPAQQQEPNENAALLAANRDLQVHFDVLMADYKKLSELCTNQGIRLMEVEDDFAGHEHPVQQQEPFCYHDGRNIVGKEFAGDSDVFPLYTSPPASKPWVGLTDEDLAGCDDEELKQARYWEAKLREKNA